MFTKLNLFLLFVVWWRFVIVFVEGTVVSVVVVVVVAVVVVVYEGILHEGDLVLAQELIRFT